MMENKMMKDYIQYRTQSGEIIGQYTYPEEHVQLLDVVGCLIMEGTPKANHYINNNIQIPRPLMSITNQNTEIIADGVDSTLIIGAPNGATITINGNSSTCDGTDINISTNVQGKLKVLITNWPSIDYEVVINAI